MTGCLIAIILSVPFVCAQNQTPGSCTGGSSSISSTNADHAQQTQDDQDQSKKRKKKKKKKGSVDDLTPSPTFSDAVAQSLLQKLADGLEGYSDRLMLSTFDQNKMRGFAIFQQQVAALFRRTDSFRVHFRIVKTSTEDAKGISLVEFEMEAIPRAADQQPVRKRDQLRFEMERGDKGWKIVDIQSRDFFS